MSPTTEYTIETYFEQEKHSTYYGGLKRYDFEAYNFCTKRRIHAATAIDAYFEAIRLDLDTPDEKRGQEFTLRVQHKHSGPYWKIEVTGD